MKKISYLIWLPVGVLSALIAGCQEQTVEKPQEIRPVRAEAVGAATALAGQTYPGTVAARYESTLSFRVGGRITARKVEVGDTVKAGQTIATLDAEDYALAAKAAESQLTAAQAERQLAHQEMRRYAELRDKNFISQAELDRRRMTLDAADARVLQLLAESLRQDNQRDYARLAAPHAGVVTAVMAEPGQVVAAGQTVATVARTDALEVAISVAESDLDALRANRALSVRLWSAPDTSYAGRLRELAPSADATSRTYRARIAFDAPSSARLGMTATVALSGTATSALSVPQTALFRVNGAPQVWVLDRQAEKVSARSVSLGEIAGDRVKIASGLKPGEWVVTAGVHALTPDQRVRLAAPAAP